MALRPLLQVMADAMCMRVSLLHADRSSRSHFTQAVSSQQVTRLDVAMASEYASADEFNATQVFTPQYADDPTLEEGAFGGADAADASADTSAFASASRTRVHDDPAFGDDSAREDDGSMLEQLEDEQLLDDDDETERERQHSSILRASKSGN